MVTRLTNSLAARDAETKPSGSHNSNTDFFYPDSLVPHIRKAWRLKRWLPGMPRQFPRSNHLKRFLEIAFHASMLTDEGRRSGFRLAFIPPTAVEEQSSEKDAPFDIFTQIQFSEPRLYTVGEVLKLAPATDLAHVLIGVCPRADSRRSSKKDLCIWGVIDTGSSWWDFTHGESQYGTPPPFCLTVSSTEPGSLTISWGGWHVLSLRQGRITTSSGDVFQHGPVARFLRDAMDSILVDVCRKLSVSRYDEEGDGEDDDYPKRMYAEFIERILIRVNEKRHGGTVLVVPDNVSHHDQRLANRMIIKYPCTYDGSWKLLIESLVQHHKYYALHRHLWDAKPNLPAKKYREIATLEAERERSSRQISDVIRTIASASGVDGAVVITDKLRLLGFGAEVIASAPALHEVFIAEDAEGRFVSKESVESYGTRHRSAFRFCSNYESSVAFVISQDGGIKGIKLVGGKLVMWRDVGIGALCV